MRLIILLPCLFVLVGCAGLDSLKEAYNGLGEYIGGKDNVEPPKELQPLENKVKLSELWDTSIGSGYADQFVNLVPAVNEEAVFAVDRKGRMQAHRRLTGEKLWEIETELRVSAGPTLQGDRLIIGSSNAEVAAYKTTDGSLLWKTTVTSEVLALPQGADGVVIIRSSDGHITGLDENSGATRWTYERSVPPLAVRSRGSPVVAGDLLIDGYASGKLIALQIKDGKLAWEATVAVPHGRSEVDRLLDLDSTPVVDGDTLYISGYQAGIAAVSLRDGEVQWRQEKISTHAALAMKRRALFLTDLSSDVWQVDMRDGGDLWKQADMHQRHLTGPAIIKEYLVLGDLEGYVHFLSQEDGSAVARIKVDSSPIEAVPVVFDNIAYIYTSGGKLVALSLE